MAENRYIGSYPVIGIRPTIDGRRGVLKVRESLEEQTMNMAKSAAKLFEENLRYSNGEPVRVVIADTTIGRVAESAACAAQFKKAGVDITLTVTPCCARISPLRTTALFAWRTTDTPTATPALIALVPGASEPISKEAVTRMDAVPGVPSGTSKE